MRSHAIKVGASYGSELDYDDDADDERLMGGTVYDAASKYGKDETSQASNPN